MGCTQTNPPERCTSVPPQYLFDPYKKNRAPPREGTVRLNENRFSLLGPDNILVSGKLANGGVASVHIASNPWAGSGYRMEIYGREGTLVASSNEAPNQDGLVLHGAQKGNDLAGLEILAKFTNVLEGMPRGAPFNVGQMYYQFGQSILSGDPCQPDFAAAVYAMRSAG